MPDPYSISQILRGIGCFLDKREGSRLLGVTVKDRWVAIDYVTADGREQKETSGFRVFLQLLGEDVYAAEQPLQIATTQ